MSQHSENTQPDYHVVHLHRDDFGSKMGLWLFLFTEILLFGGLFILYAAYRFIYPDGFAAAASELDVLLGAVNTVILLTSSLTVVLGIVALQKNNKKLRDALTDSGFEVVEEEVKSLFNPTPEIDGQIEALAESLVNS